MKKIILTAAAVFAFGFANAQEKKSSDESYGLSKGNMFVEGSVSFKSTNDPTAAVKSSYSVTPLVGYMVTDKVAVGGFLDLAGGKTPGNDKFGTFGIGAFGRYYFLSLGDNRFNAYGQVGLGYSSVQDKPAVGDKSTNSQMNANIDLGMNYFITHRLAATFTLANIFSYNNSHPQTGSNTSGTELNIGTFNNIFATPQFGLLYKW